MSAKKYVPNRLRGVLGGDDDSGSASPSNKSSSSVSRVKGKKSRPWRVDAASWKQQLQERKAVYDNFALPEKADEEKESSSQITTKDEIAEAIPLNVLTSTTAGGGGQVETMLTPRKGGQVETVFTSSLKPLSLSSPSSLTRNDQAVDNNNDDCETIRSEKSHTSDSSRSSSSSPSKKNVRRKASPLPRNRRTFSNSPDKSTVNKSRRSRKTSKSPSKITGTSPHRTKRVDGFNDNNYSSNDDDDENEDWKNGDGLMASRSVGSCDSKEYYIDDDELMSSMSKDSNVGIVNGVVHVKKKIIKNSKIFRPKTKVRLLRHGDSDDTAESIGFPDGEKKGKSSSDIPVNKSSMMQAIEDFIDPSRLNNKSDSPKRSTKSNFQWPSVKSIDEITSENDADVKDKNEIIATRSLISTNRSAGAENIGRESTTRRGGRRRQRASSNPMPQLSPATSTTSTTGMIMGNSSQQTTSVRPQRKYPDSNDGDNDAKSKNTNLSATQDDVCADSAIGDDDEWSIRPIPSEEDICLEKRRWPLRVDADTETVSSGDSDINSTTNDTMFIPSTLRLHSQKEIKTDLGIQDTDDEEEFESMALREQITLSLSPSKKKDEGNVSYSSTKKERTPKRENHRSGEVPSTTPTTAPPDPLQRARKTLMLSNMNRSVRSLRDSSSHSRHTRQDDETIGDSNTESSFSKSIFVPLRSRHQGSTSQSDSTREIPLNVLDDHGVYVSKYNKNGIYIPPSNDPVQSTTETAQREIEKDTYNELGAYVPNDKVASLLEDILQDDGYVERNEQPNVKDNSEDRVLSPPSETTLIYKILENPMKSTASNESGDDVDKEYNIDTSRVEGTLEVNEDSVGLTSVMNENEHVARIEIGDADEHSEGRASLEQLQIESASSNDNDKGDGDNLQQEGISSLVENEPVYDTNTFDTKFDSGDNTSETIQSDSDPLVSASEKQIEESTDENDGSDGDDDFAVDEIDANRIRLVSDLKRYVSSIFTGNHICVESIGTSDDPDPLATARRKRAAIKAEHHALKEKLDLKVQLNDTVSALNTDHHHVIESPGKMKSVKGKKWKERMAMKKLSKKNGTDMENDMKSNLCHQESTDDEEIFVQKEQSNDIKSIENNNTNASVVEKFSGKTSEKIDDESLAYCFQETNDAGQTSSAQDMSEESILTHTSSSFDKTHANNVVPRDTCSGYIQNPQDVTQKPDNANICSIIKDPDYINLGSPETSSGITHGAHDLSEELKSANIISIVNKPEDIDLGTPEISSGSTNSTFDGSEEPKNDNLIPIIKEPEDIDFATPGTSSGTIDSVHDVSEEPKSANIISIVNKPEDIDLGTPEISSGTTNSALDGSEEPKSDNLISIIKEPEDIDFATLGTSSGTNDSVHDVSEEPKSANVISIVNEPDVIDLATLDNDLATLDIGPKKTEDAYDLTKEPKSANDISTADKSETTYPTTQDNGLETIDDTQQLSEKQKISRMKFTPDKLIEVNPDTVDNGSNIKDSTSTIDKGGDTTTFAISDVSEGHATDITISADDNNIIQGLPPNKGKKWKDRLKKKKDKKIDKNGATKTKGDSEAGEGASEIIGIATAEHMQESILISPSNSIGEDSATLKHSKDRPSFKRNLSDLTAEEKQRAVSPINEVQAEPPLKNVGKKSNKWKNRLAKIKGSKQDNVKSVEVDVKPELPSSTSDRGQILVDFKSPDIFPAVKPEPPSCSSERGQILVDFKRPDMSSSTKTKLQSDASDKGKILVDFKSPRLSSSGASEQLFVDVPNTPKHSQKSETTTPTDTSTTTGGMPKMQSPSHNRSNMQDSKIHQNLRQSFDVFDAFLHSGHTDPIDDQSIYTEMTIGQETLLQSGLHVNQRSEEEQSYTDFTLEESIHPTFVAQKAESKVAPKDQMMSPFMSNLLSSRMFQDHIPTISKLSMPKEREEQNEKLSQLIDTSDENLKKFPTITVGNDFDDDMTQITMGSLEEDQNEKEECDEDQFFDAESKPFPRSPSSRSIGKKSKRSLTSRKSESALSHSSQLSCPETSKQRIVEILRKEVWSRDTNVVKSAMEELVSEAKNGYHHRAHIVRCGGVMTIIRAMEMNSSCGPIQILSCSTLEKLALDPQTQTTICEMEGISLIVRSMQDHFEDTQLQEAACIALATICRQQEASTSKDSMKDADEAVPTILSCMTRYTTNTRIQAKGFQAIANLCSGSHAHQRLEELSKAGGIMTLTMALQTPWENKNDQHEAISNLSILLRGITEFNEKSLLTSTGDELAKEMKQDTTSSESNEIEPMAQQEINYVEHLADTETVTSYMEDIPDMPMMSTMSVADEEIPDMPIMSTMSVAGEEIPDLDQFPTMMSNLEWQNFGEDDLDAGRKESTDPVSPNNVGARREGMDGKKHDSEEQCTIQ